MRINSNRYSRKHSSDTACASISKPIELSFKNIVTSYVLNKKDKILKPITTFFLSSPPYIIVRDSSVVEGLPTVLAANFNGELTKSKYNMLLVYKLNDFTEQLSQKDGIEMLNKISKETQPLTRIDMIQLYSVYCSWFVIKASIKCKSQNFYEINYTINSNKDRGTDKPSPLFITSLKKKVKEGCKEIIECVSIVLDYTVQTIDITLLSNKSYELCLLNIENCIAAKSIPAFKSKEDIQIVERDQPNIKIRDGLLKIPTRYRAKMLTPKHLQSQSRASDQKQIRMFINDILEQSCWSNRKGSNVIFKIPTVHTSNEEVTQMSEDTKISIIKTPRFPPLMYCQNKNLNKKHEMTSSARSQRLLKIL